MVETSKFWFEKACGDAQCRELIHPWTKSCTDATVKMLLDSIKGSYKFYAAVYMVQILMKGKKLNKQELLEQWRLYLRSGVFGFTVGTAFVTFNCILRTFFFSRFNYYTTVLLPCSISGVAIYMEPPFRRLLVVNLFVNMVFEYWVRTLEMKKYITRTPTRETLFFMFGSGILFYLMRKEKEKQKRTPIFWLFTPPKVSKETGSSIGGFETKNPSCPHRGPCLHYILKGTAQLFGVGCAMTMLRTIIPNIMNPRKAFRSITSNHWRLGLFFGGYIGIYRLVICLLCRKYGRDSASYALPAGFLAGAAFRFNPSLPFTLGPFTSIMQILGSWLYDRKLIPAHWPIPEVLYCLSQGLLFHARVMHTETCPRYILNLMRNVTSGKAEEIQASFTDMLIRNR